MRLHTHAHHGHLAHVGVHVEGLVSQLVVLFDEHVLHMPDGGFRHGEGDVGGAHRGARLHDHVDVHVGGGQFGEHLRRHARLVRHAAHGGERLAAVVRHAGDDRHFGAEIGEQVAHGFVLVVHIVSLSLIGGFRLLVQVRQGARVNAVGHDQRAGAVGERRAHMHRHVEALRIFDATQRQHLRAARGHFENRLVADAGDALGGGHDARVGGEHAVHVGVDLAHVRSERDGERDCGGVGAAASECGGVAFRVDALEAGHNRHVSLIERALDAIGLDGFDVGRAVAGVGEEAGLLTGERVRVVAFGVDGHGEQAHGDAFAGRHQHVHLALGRVGVDAHGLIDEVVGGVAHGGDHHGHGIALLLRFDDTAGDALDGGRVGHG